MILCTIILANSDLMRMVSIKQKAIWNQILVLTIRCVDIAFYGFVRDVIIVYRLRSHFLIVSIFGS